MKSPIPLKQQNKSGRPHGVNRSGIFKPLAIDLWETVRMAVSTFIVASTLISKMCFALNKTMSIMPPTGNSPTKFECLFAPKYPLSQTSNRLDLTSSEVNLAGQQTFPYEMFQRAARQIYEAYFKEQLTREIFESCMLQSGNDQNFLHAVSAEFFRRSIANLRASSATSTRNLMRIYDSIYQLNGTNEDEHALFRVTGHIKDLSPTSLQAGFHRGNHSIFMDLFRIHPSEWQLIFTHELIHSLDQFSFSALPIYQNDFTKLKLEDWAARGGKIEGVPDEIEELLWPWLKAGLNLGLLAEYRAWVVTAWIYLEETRLCHWSKTPWFEKIFQNIQQTDAESTKKLIFDYLDQHSPDRNDDIFAQPAIGKALTILRNELRENPDDPADLGKLDEAKFDDDFGDLRDQANQCR